LLADATTDFIGVWEGIDYAVHLLGLDDDPEGEEVAASLLVQLLDEGLIELYFQDADPLPEPTAPMTKLPRQEAVEALKNPKWRLPMLNKRTLWYSATPLGEERFNSLSPAEVAEAFGEFGGV
jgi:hypothetical protein